MQVNRMAKGVDPNKTCAHGVVGSGSALISLTFVAKNLETCWYFIVNEPQRERTNSLDSDQVYHKPGCTATGDG